MPAQTVLKRLDQAHRSGQISESAARNIKAWLTEPWYLEFQTELLERIDREAWEELNELFWMQIPFGTAGRRGRMAPIGCNAINRRTIGETVQALANYVQKLGSDQRGSDGPLTCVVAYDTRHRSREFAELSAEILVAAGFTVYFFDGFRATPLLSTTVRQRGCACGVMISASHNPPSDNAIKVFWEGGAQLRPPHDQAILDELSVVTELARIDFASAVRDGRIRFCGRETDECYLEAVISTGINPRASHQSKMDLGIVYSPLHGVGLTSVLPALRQAGFNQVSVYGAHATPDGDFPNVPNHVANPEAPEIFERIFKEQQTPGTDLILASDPDADRIGCAAKKTSDSNDWQALTGNQIGALLGDYLLRRRQTRGTLQPTDFVVKTLVTSDMLLRIAESYGIRGTGDVLTGFKWISKVVDDWGPESFVFGFEEAHGYLAGTYARDKDAAVAALLLAELAAETKQAGRTLHEELDRLFLKYGLHEERTISIEMTGADGIERMQAIMTQLREHPPRTLGTSPVVSVRDYLKGVARDHIGNQKSLEGPRSNVLFFDLEPPGYRIGVRPSGTEPKIKLYAFAVARTTTDALADQKRQLRRDVDALLDALRELL